MAWAPRLCNLGYWDMEIVTDGYEGSKPSSERCASCHLALAVPFSLD